MPDIGSRLLRGYALSLVVLALVWAVAYYALRLPAYLLPAPHEVLSALIRHFQELFLHASVTAAEAFLGLVAATTFGFSTGVALFRYRTAARFTMPIFLGTQAIPIIATAPIFMLWFGPGLLSKILLCTVLCYFPVLVATMKGLGQYSGQICEIMRVQGASPSEIFFHATLPGSIPTIMNGVRTSAAMAFMGAIVAEYAGASRGLGYVIIQATYRTDTVMLFAALAVSVVSSIVLISLVETVEHTFFRPFLPTVTP